MNLLRSLVSHKALSSAVFSALLFILFCYHLVFNVPPDLLLLFFGHVGYDLLFVYKKKLCYVTYFTCTNMSIFIIIVNMSLFFICVYIHK